MSKLSQLVRQIRSKSTGGLESRLDSIRDKIYENADVANTIAQQMGGAGRIKMMLGAKVFASSANALTIKWPNKERSKGNLCTITLRDDDTYDMEFFNASGKGQKSVKKYEGIYNDQLIEIFEKQTGWMLHL